MINTLGTTLAPTLWATTRLFAEDVTNSQPDAAFSDVYLVLGDLRVRKVAVQGIVVAKEEKSAFAVYSIDDGSKVAVECVVFRESCAKDSASIPLGRYVAVRGRISSFREQRRITVDVIEVVTDPNQETLWWLQVIDLHNSIYAKPVVLPSRFAEVALKEKLDEAEGRNTQTDEKEVYELEDKVLAQRLVAEYAKFDALAKVDATHLVPLVKAYIECARMDIVDFGIIVNDPTLRVKGERCIEAMLQSSARVDKQKTITTAFGRVFKILANEGYFVQIVPDSDIATQGAPDHWQVLRHDLNLGEVVLKAVQKVAGKGWPQLEETGVPVDMSLKILHNQSLILEVMPGHYKIF
ncbi:hypothetical protein BC830DRAFT_851483 [Chytriomyces sp. MP71]|nr:hypothetical protein BC830DRAFT_851483 [Chytriomyces sp. MP71]